jgi:hypothetical protein
VPASWQAYPSIPRSFSDGTSSTLLVAEKLSRCGNGGNLWGRFTPDRFVPAFAARTREPFQVQPSASACDPRRASTFNDGGLLVCLADGSGRSIAPSISPATWWAACTPAHGEVLGSDW